MEIQAESVLDDILARSERLEVRTPFRMPLSILLVKQDSEKTQSNLENSDSVRLRGQRLLAREKADVSRTKDILKSIKFESVVSYEVPSFEDKKISTLQNSIVDSIESTQRDTDNVSKDFIFKFIESNWNDEQPIHHLSYSQKYSMLTDKLSKHLSEKAAFFASKITVFPTKIAGEIADALTDTYSYTDSHRKPLADTFNLISYLTTTEKSIANSLKFLEAQRKKNIIDDINRQLSNIYRTGEIGFMVTLQAYIKQHHPTESEDFRHWAAIYYALRCGEIDEAIEYAENNSESFASNLKGALINYKNAGGSDISLEPYLRNEQVTPATDWFKLATLSVLFGRPAGHVDGEVAPFIEDWLWVRMRMRGATLEAVAEELANEPFESQQNPFLRGQLLLLVGRYEEAAQWFIESEDNADENTHIALAMHTSRLVPASSVRDCLLRYSKRIFGADPISAVRYLSLLGDLRTKVDAVATLVVESDGGVGAFEPYEEGAAPVLLSLTNAEMKASLIRSAELADERDMHREAAHLYKLAGRWDSVVRAECVELRQCVEGFVDDTSIDDAIELHREITENGADVDLARLEAMRVLMYLAAAAQCVRRREFSEAVAFVRYAGVFPAPVDGEIAAREAVADCVTALRRATPDVRKVVPAAVMVAMEAYAGQYKSIAADEVTEGESLRAIARRSADLLMDMVERIDVPIHESEIRRLLDLQIAFQ